MSPVRGTRPVHLTPSLDNLGNIRKLQSLYFSFPLTASHVAPNIPLGVQFPKPFDIRSSPIV